MWWRREEQSREGSERGQASRLAGRGRDGLAQGSQAASACESFWITFLDQFGVRCRSSVSKEVSHFAVRCQRRCRIRGRLLQSWGGE